MPVLHNFFVKVREFLPKIHLIENFCKLAHIVYKKLPQFTSMSAHPCPSTDLTVKGIYELT